MPKPTMTLEEVRALAAAEGYTVSVDEEQIIAVKTSHPQVFRIFPKVPNFLGPGRIEEYVLLQVYYWIRGYDLSDGDDGYFLLHRVLKHPAYRLTERVALHLDYVWNCNGHVHCLHATLRCWIATVEAVEQSKKPEDLSPETKPEDLRDIRIGQYARQLKTGQQGIVKTIWRWSRGNAFMDFLWVEGDGYHFCDLEENIDIEWSRRAHTQPGRA